MHENMMSEEINHNRTSRINCHVRNNLSMPNTRLALKGLVTNYGEGGGGGGGELQNGRGGGGGP